MPRQAVAIPLSESERRELERWRRAGKTERRILARIQIIELAAAGLGSRQIASRLGVGRPTALKWRRRFGQQRLAVSSMCAVDHPVVAPQALANFLLNFEQGIAGVVGQSRGEVGESGGRLVVIALAKTCLDDPIRLRVILLIVLVGLDARALGTVIGDVRIADHKVIHGSFDRV